MYPLYRVKTFHSVSNLFLEMRINFNIVYNHVCILTVCLKTVLDIMSTVPVVVIASKIPWQECDCQVWLPSSCTNINYTSQLLVKISSCTLRMTNN